MNGGLNQNIEFDGITYHIQIENIEKHFSLQVRVYVEGMIIFNKLHSYKEKIDGVLSNYEQNQIIETEIKKLFFLTKAAIEKGKIKKL